jgi:hypothetical protein
MASHAHKIKPKRGRGQSGREGFDLETVKLTINRSRTHTQQMFRRKISTDSLLPEASEGDVCKSFCLGLANVLERK